MLKDILYNKKNEIGLKDDISFGELIKLEEIVEKYFKENNLSKDDIKKLVDISMEMKNLLEKCKFNKLPIKLAKEIDDLLEKLKYM